jgi:hypothetical protein
MIDHMFKMLNEDLFENHDHVCVVNLYLILNLERLSYVTVGCCGEVRTDDPRRTSRFSSSLATWRRMQAEWCTDETRSNHHNGVKNPTQSFVLTAVNRFNN